MLNSRNSILALALLAWAGVSPAATMSAAEPTMDLDKRIENAATKADHEAIAASFEEEATRVEADIARHKRMSSAYQGARNLRQVGIRMRQHCDMLIKNYESAAIELRGMARTHREMAAELP